MMGKYPLLRVLGYISTLMYTLNCNVISTHSNNKYTGDRNDHSYQTTVASTSQTKTTTFFLVSGTGLTDDMINNIQINATPSGMAYFLLVLIFALIFGIPIIVKIYDKYLKALLIKYVGIAQDLLSQSMQRVSMRMSDVGRKISAQVRD